MINLRSRCSWMCSCLPFFIFIFIFIFFWRNEILKEKKSQKKPKTKTIKKQNKPVLLFLDRFHMKWWSCRACNRGYKRKQYLLWNKLLQLGLAGKHYWSRPFQKGNRLSCRRDTEHIHPGSYWRLAGTAWSIGCNIQKGIS